MSPQFSIIQEKKINETRKKNMNITENIVGEKKKKKEDEVEK